MTPEYADSLESIRRFHSSEKTFTGRRMIHSLVSLEALCRLYRPKTLFDHGCGKGVQWSQRDFDFLGKTIHRLDEHLGVVPTCYDPGVPEFDDLPNGVFDCSISVDVLEYVPEGDLPAVLDEMFSRSRMFVFIHTADRPSAKECAAPGPWNRTTNWWVQRFVEAGVRHPGVAWYARIREEGAEGMRALYAGRDDRSHYRGKNQFDDSSVLLPEAE